MRFSGSKVDDSCFWAYHGRLLVPARGRQVAVNIRQEIILLLSEYASLIYSTYGPAKRARMCYIYTQKGVRLVDMYQENAKAILGYGDNSAFTVFKNTLNKGITGFFLSHAEPKLQKAVSTLLSSKRLIYCFYQKQEAIDFAKKISPTPITFWRAFSGINYTSCPCVILEPPLAWGQDIFILCLCPTAIKNNLQNQLPPTYINHFPAPLSFAIAKSIYNYIAAQKLRCKKDWFLYDKVLTKFFLRQGPYLYPKMPKNQYDDFILKCLKCHIIINPTYETPSIVPFGATQGDFTLLKNAL